MDRILLVLDVEGDQRAAMAWALAEAERRAPCTVAATAVSAPEGVLSVAPQEPFVAWTPGGPSPGRVPSWERAHEQRHEAQRHEAQGRLDRMVVAATVPEGVTVEAEVLDHARHHDALVRRAGTAALVVVDSRHAGIDQVRLVREVLRQAGVPVVLVP